MGMMPGAGAMSMMMPHVPPGAGSMPHTIPGPPVAAATTAQDYTTFSALSGNNVRMNPFASPHTAYPNAMRLSSTIDIPPAVGYGAPRYPSFAKPGMSRLFFVIS